MVVAISIQNPSIPQPFGVKGSPDQLRGPPSPALPPLARASLQREGGPDSLYEMVF